MKKHILKLATLLLLIAYSAMPTIAQTGLLDETPGCLVSDVTGKVTYTEKGNSTPKPVTAGTVLPEDATVSVGKKSNFTLICDDRSLMVDKKGVHQAAVLSKEVQAKGEVSRFAKMAFAAKGYVQDTAKLKKPFGDKDTILFKLPKKDKLPIGNVKIAWFPIKSKNTFKLFFFQQSVSEPIMAVQLSGDSFSFDATNLDLGSNKTCNIQVFTNDMKHSSKILEISFVQVKDFEAVQANLQKSKEYKLSNHVNQKLMEAIEYESNGFNSAAMETYLTVLSETPRNVVANQMYAAFMERMSK